MVTTVPTDPSAPQPSAIDIAAAMAQGVLPMIPVYGLPASALLAGAVQLAHMLAQHDGAKVLTFDDLDAIAKSTGANVDAFSAKVDSKFPKS